MSEIMDDFMNGDVKETVENAVTLFGKARAAQTLYEEVEKALKAWRDERKHQWSLRIEINHMGGLFLQDKNNKFNDVEEGIIEQFLNLMSAVAWSEFRDAVDKFNNSLKGSNDGKNTD